MARAVTDLPEPDSPTIPTISPRRTVSDTSRTASTSPSGVGNVTDRPLTASRVSWSSTAAGIEGAAVGRDRRTGWRRPAATCASPSPRRLKVTPAMTIAIPGAIAPAGLM